MPSQETGLLGAVNEWARDTPWLHPVVLDYATYGVVLFAVLLLAGWWVARHRGSSAVAASLWTPVAMLLAVAVNQPIGQHFAERRPYDVDPHLLVLAHRSNDFSFPSDHAVMAGAVAAGLLLVDRRLGAVATAAALVMAFARVYVAAHYPHDVVAGLVLGSGVVVLTWLLLRRPLTMLVDRLALTPLRPLLVAAAEPSTTPPSRAATAGPS